MRRLADFCGGKKNCAYVVYCCCDVSGQILIVTCYLYDPFVSDVMALLVMVRTRRLVDLAEKSHLSLWWFIKHEYWGNYDVITAAFIRSSSG